MWNLFFASYTCEDITGLKRLYVLILFIYLKLIGVNWVNKLKLIAIFLYLKLVIVNNDLITYCIFIYKSIHEVTQQVSNSKKSNIKSE